jgi:dGTPase
MTHNSRQPFYERQREQLISLADRLLAANGEHLDPTSLEAFSNGRTTEAKKRAIVDRVASLTDPAAMSLHALITT